MKRQCVIFLFRFFQSRGNLKDDEYTASTVLQVVRSSNKLLQHLEGEEPGLRRVTGKYTLCMINLHKVRWGNSEQSGQKQYQPKATSIVSRLHCLHEGGVWQ